MDSIAGGAWLVVVAGGAAALGVALIVAAVMYLTRDRSLDARAERKTKQLYDNADIEQERERVSS